MVQQSMSRRNSRHFLFTK